MKRPIISIFILAFLTFPGLSFAAQPSAITDLAASNPMPNSVTLTWTAPANNGDYPNLEYDIRYSTSPINTEEDWSNALMTVAEPDVAAPGTSHSMFVTFLEPETTYYFAIKTRQFTPFGQGVGMVYSGLSNVVSMTTLPRQGNVYYVAQTDGDDSYNGLYDSYQGGSNGPWRTILKAARTLTAGDIVYIRGGRYENEKGSHYGPGWDAKQIGGIDPSNSGAAGNNIVYRNYPGEIPVIDPLRDHSGFYNDHLNYIVYDGLKFENVYSIGFSSHWSDFIMIKNCHIEDIWIQGGDLLAAGIFCGGNYAGMGGHYHIYRNNLIYNVWDELKTDNCMGILMYNPTSHLIDGNEIYDTAMGIDAKRYGLRLEICNNKIHGPNTRLGIALTEHSDYCYIYNNIVYNTDWVGLEVSYAAYCDYNRIWNNTVHNTGKYAPYKHGSLMFDRDIENVQVWNNILSDGDNVDTIYGNLYETHFRPQTGLELDYNCYWNLGYGVVTPHLAGPFGIDLAQYQQWCKDHPEYHPTVTDDNSISQDPLFVDPDNGDFTLQANSPCRGTGYGGVDMGVYPVATDCANGIGPGELGCYEICQCSDETCDCPVHTVPSLSQPSKGESIVDPSFHTTITRITDADNDLGLPDKHMRINYARFDIANSDGSMILLLGNSGGGWHLYNGNTFEYIKALNPNYIDTGHGDPEQRWDDTDPNVFYHRRGAILYKYTIGAPDTNEVVHNFKNEYPTATYIGVAEEGSPSRDCRYWAFFVDSGYTRLAYIVYDMETDTIIGEWPNPPSANWISMSPSGERVVVGSYPVKSYKRDFTGEVTVATGAGHADLGIDADGNDVIVYFADSGGNNWLNVADIATGIETPLIYWEPYYGYNGCHNVGGHISGIDNPSRGGWAVVSTLGPYQDATCWPDQSIYLVELKENPRVWRIAHHHSYYSAYGANPFATINTAGTKIFFNSNWDNTSATLNTLDVYQVELPSTWWSDLGGGPGNNPPTANASANPTNGVAPLTVNFTGSGSDSDGTIVSYSWNFGDGSSSSEQNPTHTYNEAGTYTATLTVTDDDGATGSDSVNISVSGEPNDPPTASATANPTSGNVPLTVNFTGSGSDTDGTIVSYSWDFGDGSSSQEQNPSHTYNSPGNYTATLTVTDDDGATGTDTISISVTLAPGQYISVFGDVTGSDYTGTCSDTFVNVGEGSVNYSTNNLSLNTYTWPINTVANRIVIKWDVSAIPSNATIHSATLSLYMYGYEGSGGDDQYDISIHKIINHNPVISACTWNTYDGVNAWTGGSNGGAQDMAAAEDTNTIDKTAGYKSWTVTNMVQDWVSNPLSNYGMMLDSDSTAASDSNRFFRPTEYSNPDQRPELVVTYSVGEEPDTIDPTITITSPTSGDTYSTSQSTIDLGGTASDNVGITSVTWVNDEGGSGTASGTTEWTISNISLQEGDNVITVTAHDAAGNTGSDILTVTYSPFLPPDTIDPTVTITSPIAGDTYSTEEDSINMGGSASDNVGVTSVTWINNQGGSGTASGTDNWTISGITLPCGEHNIITVTAQDAAGNTGTDTLTIDVKPCAPTGLGVQ